MDFRESVHEMDLLGLPRAIPEVETHQMGLIADSNDETLCHYRSVEVVARRCFLLQAKPSLTELFPKNYPPHCEKAWRGWAPKETTCHKTGNDPQKQRMAWITEVACRMPARSTSPSSCSTGSTLRELCRKTPYYRERGPGEQGRKWLKYRYYFC